MRFFLDHDVDARCRRVLTRRGHDCFTASDAGRARVSDEEQAIYALEARAVLITHDREFTLQQRRNTVGRHVRLDCDTPDGPEVLDKWIDDAIPALEHREYVVVELRVLSFQVMVGDTKETATRRRLRKGTAGRRSG